MEINVKKFKKDHGMKIKFDWFYCVMLVIIVIWSISFLAILGWGILASFAKIIDFNAHPIEPWTWEFTFQNYEKVFTAFKITVGKGFNKRTLGIFELIFNSFIYAGGCAFTSTFIPMLTGYAMGRYHKYKFSSIMYVVNLVAMTLPVQGSLPAQIEMMKTFHLYDRLYGLIISQGHFIGMPTIIFSVLFKGQSKEIQEAAEIDGANEFIVMVRILFPMARNLFFTYVLCRFVGYWNDYQTPYMFMQSYPTLAYGVFNFSMSADNDLAWDTIKIAGTMIMVIPTTILFSVFHDKFLVNISMGGVKE